MDCYLIDGGTTNTRVWLRRGLELIGPVAMAVGVRDTAIEGSNARLKRELGRAFAELGQATFAVAAGMITSPQGLMLVPHCQAPAGAVELAAAAAEAQFDEFPGIRWLLVPGVRSGPRDYDAATVSDVDVIRGEETELAGALSTRRVRPPFVYIHIGSHTKAIRVAADGRIVSGVSTLGGELLHVVSGHTILASAVSNAGPAVSPSMLEAGAGHARRFGLSRALFLVRLLELQQKWSPAELAGFLRGALVETDLQAILPVEGGIAVSGPDAALPAWQKLLAARGIAATLLGSADREACFLAGIQSILSIWFAARPL